MKEDRKPLEDIIAALHGKDSDFPAMSKTMSVINQLASSEETSATELANTILKDYALTNKVLRLVNTAAYAHYGGVTTVSRALIVMGFEAIRDVALALKLFEHLTTHARTPELRDLVLKSLYSALLASDIAADMEAVDREEAFICSLFHSFGEVIVAFHYPEKYGEILEMVEKEGIRPVSASRLVLGISFEEVGMGLARHWNFPPKIVSSMEKISGSQLTGRLTEADKLRGLANLSHGVAAILSSGSDDEKRQAEIRKLIGSYSDAFVSTKKNIGKHIGAALGEMGDYSRALDLGLKGSSFVKKVTRFSAVPGEGREPGAPRPVHAAPSGQQPPASPGKTPEGTAFLALDGPRETGEPEGTEMIFTRGIQDITAAIFQKNDVNDILRMILETMYRALQTAGVSRVIFFIKDAAAPVMRIRFGFGSDVEELKRWFTISLDESGTIFSLSMAQQRDLMVRDVQSPETAALLPDWFKRRMPPDAFFMTLPILIEGKPIGLFYIEGACSEAHRVSSLHVNYLKILRDQFVLAVRQKRGR